MDEDKIIVTPDFLIMSLESLAKKCLKKPKKENLVLLTHDPEEFRKKYVEYMKKNIKRK